MAIVYIGMGSNEGDRLQILRKAALNLKKNVGILYNYSSIYETAAWGFESDHSFLNAVMQFETEHSPQEILNMLQYLENQAGRIRSNDGTYIDRVLDLDLLYYDQLISDEEKLQIPHPRIAERNFVLYPLTEIDANWVDARTNLSIKSLLDQTKDISEIKTIEDKLF